MGTIARPNSPLTTADGYGEVDENEVEIYTLVNGNIDHDNIKSEGVRNANIDKDEVFARETWNNRLAGGHFPLWSNGTSAVPDDWTAELTATIARDTAPTYAISTHYSCKITGNGEAVEGIYQTIALRKNTTYTVSLKVKATDGDTATVKVVDGDAAEKMSEDYTDASWQTDANKKYKTFTTGTTTNAGAITIKLLAKNDTDMVWFGEVQITEGSMAKGYDFQAVNADTVDDLHANATPTASKLCPLNASTKIQNDLVVTASITDANVLPVKLKTSQGNVSHGASAWSLKTLPGGEYGFYPQTKQSSTNACSTRIVEASAALGASYVSYISLAGNDSGPTTVYAQQRYITASGEDYFIFLVYDNVLNRIISSYSAPDHPCYGNGDNEELVPHPFANYWKTPLPSNLEIILIEKNDAKKIQKKVTRNKSAVEIIEEGYDLDIDADYKKDLDISNYEGKHRKLQKLHKDVKYKKLKAK